MVTGGSPFELPPGAVRNTSKPVAKCADRAAGLAVGADRPPRILSAGLGWPTALRRTRCGGGCRSFRRGSGRSCEDRDSAPDGRQGQVRQVGRSDHDREGLKVTPGIDLTAASSVVATLMGSAGGTAAVRYVAVNTTTDSFTIYLTATATVAVKVVGHVFG